MKKLLVLLFVVAGINTFAQKESVINDANAEKRILNGDFTSISVSDGVSLYLSGGGDESIAVSASDPKYMERYKTEVVNGVLKIYYDNSGLSWTGFDKRKLKAYVSYKTLEKISASSGSLVSMKTILAADEMQFSFTSGSKFTGEVNVKEMNANVSSGAEIEINGSTEKLKVDASSGAIFKGYEFATDFCDAKATSGGGVRINVNKELSVKANSGGGIRYKGTGVIKDMNVNSGGVVKKG
jgi:hypothetical protein